MAGGKLYISEMLEELQGGMNSMREDMANMVEKMLIVAENTAETARIIGSSASTVFIKDPETVDEAEHTIELYQPGTYNVLQGSGKTLKTMTPKCNGSVLIEYDITIAVAANSFNSVHFLKIGDTTAYSQTVNAGRSARKTGVLVYPVQYDVPFSVVVKPDGNCNVDYTIHNIKLHYNLASLVEDGPFVMT